MPTSSFLNPNTPSQTVPFYPTPPSTPLDSNQQQQLDHQWYQKQQFYQQQNNPPLWQQQQQYQQEQVYQEFPQNVKVEF